MPSQASSPTVSVMAMAGAPNKLRRCLMARSAEVLVSPLRSGGPASAAVCRVRKVARSASESEVQAARESTRALSEPLAARKKGAKPKVFLIADEGFNPYVAVAVTRRKFAQDFPDLVKAFVAARTAQTSECKRRNRCE